MEEFDPSLKSTEANNNIVAKHDTAKEATPNLVVANPCKDLR